ncbi:unnamed protein product [Rhizophagus irregularis]|uniref:PQ-loop-domain-containing protein n=1 Tax=Rhizophagus irregularis TaxID=588596 RepID=A0A2I1GYH7_9GLOM|nr:PQ-loop-domain-containing protein [Rhizophagus irregularis]CAB4435978.1 unnamed protein product [Rhizophagus irregularis]
MKGENTIPSHYVVLENVFGLIGTAFWSFQLVPQAYKNWRGKSTKGLSQAMFLLWTTSSIFFGIYAIVLDLSIPLLIQPQIFGIIALFIYVQCFYYCPSMFEGSKIKSGVLFVILTILLTGIEVGSVYGIRYANMRNINWPEMVSGIIPAVLLVIGLVPQFIKIYQLKRVIGISMIFMAFDMLGAFFSVLSLVFRPPPFDTLASFTYISVFTLDGLIVFLYYFLNWYHSRKQSAINNNNNEENDLSIIVVDDVKRNDAIQQVSEINNH